VIDTGIRITHQEFDAFPSSGSSSTMRRAVWGANFVASSPDTDENGHGTHVAGTIGGLTYGMAPQSRLVAMKVFDKNGQGPWSNVLSAMDWACNDTDSRRASGLSVVNLSLGGGYFAPVNDAVRAAVARNVTVVVAAGNAGTNVAGTSPASCAEAITVAAIDGSDTRPSWSNYGAGVDVFAPGDAIKSAWIGSDTDSATLSGTSMATPHVAGLAAYLMRVEGPLTPNQMSKRVAGLATRDMVVNPGDGSPNAIAFNGNELFL
jgi:oryzin